MTKQWALPEIIEGSVALQKILVEPETDLEPFIRLDSKTRRIFFNGNELSKQISEQETVITIRLIDQGGTEEVYE